MEAVLRGILVYVVLFAVIRLCGKRMIQTSTPFGLILTFLISNSVADALKEEDRSVVNSFILAFTLVLTHFAFLHFKKRFRSAEKLIDDVPSLLMKDGQFIHDRMLSARVTEEDIIAAARKDKIPSISGIKYALLEIDGSICVIPKDN